MKNINTMRKFLFILMLIFTLSACDKKKEEICLSNSNVSEYHYNKSDTENRVYIVELGSELGKGSLSLKKIYIKDHLGFTHEILCSSTRMCSGGEYMLELCKYKE